MVDYGVVEGLSLEVVEVNLIHVFPVGSATALRTLIRLFLRLQVLLLRMLLMVLLLRCAAWQHPITNQVLLALLLLLAIEVLLGHLGHVHHFTTPVVVVTAVLLLSEEKLGWTRSNHLAWQELLHVLRRL